MAKTKSGKRLAELIEALHDDITEASGDSGLDQDRAIALATAIKEESVSTLEERSIKEGKRIRSSVFDFALDSLFNFCIYDNCHRFKAEQYELLAHRYDMAWFYFRNFIDSFNALRGLVEEAKEASETGESGK